MDLTQLTNNLIGCSADPITVGLRGDLLLLVFQKIGVVIVLVGEGDHVVVDLLLAAVLDVDIVGDVALGLEPPGLVRVVLLNNVALFRLEVAQTDQDDVVGVDPDLLPHLTTDVGQALFAVEAVGIDAPVAEDLGHLGVLLPIFFQVELALGLLVLVLASAAVLASFSFVFGHG